MKCNGEANVANGFSTFIASVHDNYNLRQVARKINHRGSEAYADWSGLVERTHSMIKVLIISGESHTCDIIRDVAGIKSCEADSEVTAV